MGINNCKCENRFGFLLKTYEKDFVRVQTLVNSFNRHNADNIPLAIVAPKADLQVLNLNQYNNILTIDEESLINQDFFDTPVHGMSPGYLNQQVIKLKFWEAKIFDHYFCIDSDLIFIKDFYISDFINSDGDPYLFTTSFYELIIDPFYYDRFWKIRSEYFKMICDHLEYDHTVDFAVHGMTTLSAKILSDMRNSLKLPDNKWYKNLISKSPLEFSWYLVWCLKSGHQLNRRESQVKTFHTRNEHLIYLLRGISLEDLKRSYIAIIINSNYANNYNVTKYNVPFVRLCIPSLSRLFHYLKKLMNINPK